jgi:hypothetical protein
MLIRIKLSASRFLYIKFMHISVCTPSSPNWYTIFTPCLVHCPTLGLAKQCHLPDVPRFP